MIKENFKGLKTLSNSTIYPRGTQIAHIPNHAYSLSDEAVEYGFITGRKDSNSYFCRFWSNSYPLKLRTKSNSELCYTHNLVKIRLFDQQFVDAHISTLGGD